jgi:hypothetical protein
MNVFVLNTGRCGSTTFAAACAHVTNFTVAHESRVGALGAARFDYPRRHIEVDNRLSWFLGRLEQRWGQEAFYVHLTRDVEATARSFSARYSRGIMLAYRTAILPRLPKDAEPLAVARDYCETVNRNIERFLADKPHAMRIELETAARDFPAFWSWIGAEGDLAAAVAEFGVKHNAARERSRAGSLLHKLRRTLVGAGSRAR